MSKGINKIVAVNLLSGNEFKLAFGVSPEATPTIPKGYLHFELLADFSMQLSINKTENKVGLTIKGANRG